MVTKTLKMGFIAGKKDNGTMLHAYSVVQSTPMTLNVSGVIRLRSLCERVKTHPQISNVTPVRKQGETLRMERLENGELGYLAQGVPFEEATNIDGKEISTCSRCKNLHKNMEKYEIEDLLVLRMLVQKKIGYSKWAEYKDYPLEWLEAL